MATACDWEWGCGLHRRYQDVGSVVYVPRRSCKDRVACADLTSAGRTQSRGWNVAYVILSYVPVGRRVESTTLSLAAGPGDGGRGLPSGIHIRHVIVSGLSRSKEPWNVSMEMNAGRNAGQSSKGDVLMDWRRPCTADMGSMGCESHSM